MVEDEVYVMLMMMRSDENYTAVEGCTAEELLACFNATDYDACIAKCADEPEEPEEPEVVKNGTLTVSVDDRSSEVVAAPRIGTIILNTINLKASEEITVDTLTLKAAWLTDNTSVKKVWFEKDGARISSKAGLTSDGTATVNFTKGLTVKSNEKIDLVADLSWAAWSQITLELDSVNSTAEKNNISWKTTTYNLINYTVAWISYTINGINTAKQVYKLWEQNEILFAKVDLENTSNDKAVDVKSITFNSNNTNVEKVLTNFTLVRDGKNVAKSATFDGKKVTITLNDSIEASKTAKYSLYAEVQALDNGDEDFSFSFDKEDIVAYEEWNNFRTTNTDAAPIAPSCTTPIVNCMTVAGWKIVLSNDSSFATTVNANAGYSDVQIANGTLTVAEPVHFEKLEFTDDTIAATQNNVKSLKLEIGWKTYNATIDRTTAPNTYTFEEIYVNKTSNVKMYVSFANAIAGGMTSLKIAGNNIVNTMFVSQAGAATNVWDYQNNSASFNNSDIAWSIKVATVSIKDTTFTLKNNLSSTVRSVIWDSNSVVLFSGNATSTKWDVEMSEITVAGTAIAGTDYLDLTLKVNGKTVSTKKYTTTAITFPINSVTVSSEPVSIELEAIPHTTAWNGAQTYTLTVAAAGTFNGNTATATAVNAATLQVVTNSSLVISSINQPNQIKLEGNDVELMKFDVTAQYGNVDLTTFKVETTATLTSPQLVIDDSTTVNLTAVAAAAASCEDKDWTAVTAANETACTALDTSNPTAAPHSWTDAVAAGFESTSVDETLTAWKHTFVVKANVHDTDVADGNWVTVTTTNVVVNGTPKAMATNTLFVKAMPTMTVAKDWNVMTIKVKNESDTPITLKQLQGTLANTSDTLVVNWQAATFWTDLTAPVTLGKNEEATIEITVSAAWTDKLTGITYYVEDGWYTYTYTVNSTYTTYPRGNFQVTYK